MSKDRKSDEIWVVKFDEESAQDFRDSMMESSKGDASRPIIVYIDSYGGQVDALAKMIETMDETPNPIVTVAMGKAMSCGAVLLSHGDYRFCGKHSRVMIHEVSSGTSGDVHDMHADVLETKRLNKHFLGLLANNCNLKGGYDSLRKIIKGNDGRDLYLDANSAVKFGVVDKVGLPKLEPVILYNMSIAPQKKKKITKETKDSKSENNNKTGGKGERKSR